MTVAVTDAAHLLANELDNFRLDAHNMQILSTKSVLEPEVIAARLDASDLTVGGARSLATWSIDDLDPPGITGGLRCEFATQRLGRTGEKDRDVQPPRGAHAALDDGPRRAVAAHRVDRDHYGHGRRRLGTRAGRTGLFLADGADLAAAVVAAVPADNVRQLELMTLGAFTGADGLEGVVGAPLRGAGLGVSAFWIRHGSVYDPGGVISILSAARAAGLPIATCTGTSPC